MALVSALLLGGCSRAPVPGEAEPGVPAAEPPSAVAFAASCVRADGWGAPDGAVAVDSAEALARYIEEYAPEGEGWLPDLAETLGAYGAAYFEDGILVLAAFTESSGSVGHAVTAVVAGAAAVTVAVTRTVPEIGTCDMATVCLVVELPGSCRGLPIELDVTTENN